MRTIYLSASVVFATDKISPPDIPVTVSGPDQVDMGCGGGGAIGALPAPGDGTVSDGVTGAGGGAGGAIGALPAPGVGTGSDGGVGVDALGRVGENAGENAGGGVNVGGGVIEGTNTGVGADGGAGGGTGGAIGALPAPGEGATDALGSVGENTGENACGGVNVGGGETEGANADAVISAIAIPLFSDEA